MKNNMLFASATTTEPDAALAASAVADLLAAQMKGSDVDLALVFVSGHGKLGATQVIQEFTSALPSGSCLGCTAEGVIGSDREIEREPGVAVVAAHLPGVAVESFAIEPAEWQSLLGDDEAFRQAVAAPAAPALFILMADPFSSPIDEVLEAFNRLYPGVPVIGGIASGAAHAGSNVLAQGGRLLSGGAVGVALSGALQVDVVVSQGCRPIGHPLTVTAAHDNVILGLDSQAPLLQLSKLVAALSERDQALLHHGLLVGRAINPQREDLGRGDFLIRGVMGADRESGAIVIGDYVQEGETIQFQVRDAATAQEDLEMMLLPQTFFEPPAGALLFSCNGRGTRLYDHPNGDIGTLQETLGNTKLAGFFCAGEIGPIGGRNFLHGHTASMALFRPAPAS